MRVVMWAREMLKRSSMRSFLQTALPLLLFLDISPATAGPFGGGGSRGPLGQTSSGISTATSAGSSGSSGSGSATTSEYSDDDVRHEERCYERRRRIEIRCAYARRIARHDPDFVVIERREVVDTSPAYTGDRARLDVYAGAHKVMDSDGALTLELAASDGYRFRIAGSLHHYFETQPDASRVTMTMPSLTAGVRIDDLGSTAVHVEAGVVHASTRDVMGDSSITGPVIGLAVEHRLSPKVSVLGEVRRMWFQDEVRASAGRVGLRIGHLQASLRVLDFNVGPPLLGPELGVRF